ncbi:MAG: O-antigen ligase family protein [Ginsengibacter sp.]
MKKLFFINDSFDNKISYSLLAGFLIALPFEHFYSEILLTCFAIHTLIHLKKSRLKTLKNKTVWIISSIFFLNLLAICYSNYPAEGFKDVDHQLSMILFPVCLSVTNLDMRKYQFSFLKIFGITCTITIVYLYIHAFRVIHYFHFSFLAIFSKTFINQNFSAPIELHSTYLSMYVALSISIFLFLFFKKPDSKNSVNILFSAVLFAGLIQLSSRSVFIAISLIIIIAIPALLLQGKERLHFSVVSLIIFFVVIWAITNIDSLRKRYVNDLKEDLSETAVTPDLTETRMKRWVLEWQLIKQSPLIGYGSGSEKQVLKNKYFEEKFYRSYLVELNAHSQYLSFLINSGIVGLLLYLYILSYGFSRSIKKRDFLLLAFLILIAVVSVSENILDVNKGIFFYSFFSSIFLLNHKEKMQPG